MQHLAIVHKSMFTLFTLATICCILVSHPPPACFFGTRFAGIIVYFTILRSVLVDATDLHADLLLSELHNS